MYKIQHLNMIIQSPLQNEFLVIMQWGLFLHTLNFISEKLNKNDNIHKNEVHEIR